MAVILIGLHNERMFTLLDDLITLRLYEYMWHAEARYNNDVILLENNIAYRRADPVDHLEMIMAQTRLGTAIKIFEDQHTILKMGRG